ncbi:MAG: trigger factor [Nitrospirae bacterium]|nr:MAG: trigger factor [Nitrospirota bacterium]
MKVDVTELGPVKRALKIEVPSQDVNKQFALAYAELNKQVRIPGFRPGKAPLAMLEKRYAKEVEEDVIRRLVPDYYERAVRESGIVPVLVEIPPLERVKIKKDAAFSFTATVEIKPKIELRDYKAPNPISLKPDKRTVTDEQVTGTLEVLRERQAQLEAAPADTALAEGDYAVLDVEGFLDQAPVEGAKQAGQLHKVGSNAPILGIEVDAALVGKKEGDLVEIPQPYPASHPDQRLAGKTVVYRATVTAVKRKKLPVLDDEFAKDCGPYASMAELTDKLRAEMEKALKKDIEDTYKDTILKRLEETHHFDLPDTLVERELEAIVRQQMQARQRQKGQPVSPDPVVRQEEIRKAREEHKAEAMRRVKVGLVLEAIADKEGLKVEQEDIQNELLRLSQELRMAPEELGRLIQSGGQDSIDELRARILADKALDFVFRHSVIQG